ncbi:MAG: hypothetical protein CO108_17630 [Deltaproteobacteria bacterium CG_4_9_14_3_um_filter_63_12]|nr:MAG: hypothetical protein CO108_17630 [Deltaproteobacteria bacterium CG_4_9_14_3_um_filter_63_12]
MKTSFSFLLSVLLLTLSTNASAQYNKSAGQNAPMEAVEVEKVNDKTGQIEKEMVQRRVQGDSYGNAQGSDYDLAVDGAFEGQTIVVLDFYNVLQADAKSALERKGFSVYRYSNAAPEPKELEESLAKANQLWIISSCDPGSTRLSKDHLKVIKDFFDAGHGLYIWGDNDPCLYDANAVATYVFDTKLEGDVPGDQTVTLFEKEGEPGVLPGHLLTTGIEHIYEGVTVATLQPTEGFKPLIYGSAGNLIAGYYDQDGKRAIIDGGFTRLYYKWDTAGTGRYVMNAAAWLANAERFGDVVNPKLKEEKQ